MGEWRLGKELAQLRGQMTQAELGRRVNLSRTRIGQLESGRVRWPSAEIFNALAHALGVPVTRLLRAAGATIPEERSEEADWLASQLDEEGLRLWLQLGHAILPQHRRRPETAEPPDAPAAPEPVATGQGGQSRPQG